MPRRPLHNRFRTPLLLVAAALTVLVVGAGSASSDPGGQPHRDNGHGHWFAPTCAAAPDGFASCDAQIVTDSAGTPLASGSPPSGALGPPQFAGAYSLPACDLDGNGRDRRRLRRSEYRERPRDVFSLSTACRPARRRTAASRRSTRRGGTSYPTQEQRLGARDRARRRDCPRDLPELQDRARRGELELVRQPRSRRERGSRAGRERRLQLVGRRRVIGRDLATTSYFNHPGLVITFSSGDDGYGVEYPAASPYVVAVGGTTLTVTGGPATTATAARRLGPTAARAAPVTSRSLPGRRTPAVPSGRSSTSRPTPIPIPGPRSTRRYGSSGWLQVGGTSLSSPLIAAVYALSGNTSNGSAPYGNAGALHDVTSGSNGTCSPAYLCTAGVGYDGPTGLGTPNGLAAFDGSAPPPPSPDYTLGVSPPSQTVTQAGFGDLHGDDHPQRRLRQRQRERLGRRAPTTPTSCTLTAAIAELHAEPSRPTRPPRPRPTP